MLKQQHPILEALKSPAKTKLKIICMLTEKRDSKNHTILSVEDLQGSATVLVPQKAPEEVKKKALMLLPDQVICLAVIKTRTNLLMVEDIIFPEIGKKHNREHKNQSMQFLPPIFILAAPNSLNKPSKDLYSGSKANMELPRCGRLLAE